MTRVLIFYPTNERRQALGRIFVRSGFQVLGVADKATALRRLYQNRPEVIVLSDSALQSPDSFLRTKPLPRLPVIVIGHGGEFSQAMALEAGADMYINESAGAGELIARVNALLRRYRTRSQQGTMLDPNQRQVLIEGRTFRLTPTEFRLFSCLVFNEDKIVCSPQLVTCVWDNKVSMDTLQFYVRRLRNKLDLITEGGYRILNYRGEGYCYCRVGKTQLESEAGPTANR
ncbi:MAG: response regulator transcription factor [Chloroflexi bacterium]|nr:response regulator transcription factor [Chloroflexota bacterium]